MNERPLITVAIPAYNRAEYLAPLLDSIIAQDFDDFEILICEDNSPERTAIKAVSQQYIATLPDKIRYVENAINLGYDGNIRKLVEHSKGQYCFFMGNDDLMCAGALSTISDIVSRIPNCGVVVRSYATFEVDPLVLSQVFRYFREEYVIDPGPQAIEMAFRRSVVIPGMVVHRDSADLLASDRFDGTLLYQLYLVGIILARRSVVFTPQIIALRRNGTPPDFGNCEAEKGMFMPQNQTPESSLHFMRGMLKIAQHIETQTGHKVFEAIRYDIGSYSYPILAIQANRPILVFLQYGLNLGKMGFWRYPLFHTYFAALLLLGPDRVYRLVGWIKQRLGYTPRFGTAR